MLRNTLSVAVVVAALLFIGGGELSFINGRVATLVLVSGAMTALVFSALKRGEGVVSTNEGQELAAAAERYLRSMSEEDRARFNESIEVKGFGITSKITGRRLVSDNILILIPCCMLAGFMYFHHVTTVEALTKVLEATVENTYVLSLPQAERDKLNIAMPESLRRKVRSSRE